MANPEKGNRFVEGYKTLNKFTFVGFLGVAAVGAAFAPSLIAPAPTLAAIDGAQIVALHTWQNRNKAKSA